MKDMGLDSEVWVPVNESNGRYEVSSLGRVRSLYFFTSTKNGELKKQHKSGKIKKQSNCGKYLTVSMFINGVTKSYYVHRVVLESFLPINDTMQVNHKDLNTKNNKLNNLEWVTPYENIRHAIDNGVFDGISNFRRQRELKKSANGSHPWKQDSYKKKIKEMAIKRWKNFGVQKLSINQILEIEKSDLSGSKLSKHYGVGKKIIQNIKNKKYNLSEYGFNRNA